MTAILYLVSLAGAAGAIPQQQIAARIGLEQKLEAKLPLHARFRDEHSAPVELGSFFEGKPVILTLAYYQCPNLCTLVLNGILQTAQELKLNAGEDYQIVVVSIDPHDLPALAAAKKQSYIERYRRAGASNGWHFLVGDREAIAQVADAVGYRFAYDEETRQFAHPSTIVVLTPEGKISRYFPGIEYPAREVRLALGEASHERVGSLADRIFLLCFHYNAQTGKYGVLISRMMQVAGIGSALALALYIAVMAGHDRRPRRTLS